MKKISKYPLMLLTAASLLLAGCDNPITSESKPSINVNDETIVTDIRSAIDSLKDVHNYTALYQLSDRNGGLGTFYHNYYKDNYVYSDRIDQEWGYVQSEEGVYPVTMRQEGDGEATLVGGELLPSTELYTGDLFTTIGDLDSSWFEEGKKEVVIDKKVASLAILDLMGMSATQILSLEEAKVSVDDTLSSLEVSVTFAYQVWTMTIYDIGNTTSATMDSFLENGGTAFQIPSDLDLARLVFKENNYSRDVINYSTGVSDGIEYFLPTYFYGDYTSTSLAFSQGLLALNHKQYKGNDMYGSYLFYIQNNSLVLVAAGTGADGNPIYKPYNSNAEIHVKGNYNYPCNLELWNHMEEFVESSSGVYDLYNVDLIKDFASNNQVDLDASSLVSERLTMKIENAENQNNLKITFTMYYGSEGNSEANQAVYPFFDFGTSELRVVEEFLDSNNLR